MINSFDGAEALRTTNNASDIVLFSFMTPTRMIQERDQNVGESFNVCI